MDPPDHSDKPSPEEPAGTDAKGAADEDLDTPYQPAPEPPPAPQAPPISARTELPFGLVFVLILALGVGVFAVQNTQDVTLNFLGWTGRYPLAVVIIAVVVVSVILDEILGLVLRRRKRRRLAERRELERLRQMSG